MAEFGGTVKSDRRLFGGKFGGSTRGDRSLFGSKFGGRVKSDRNLFGNETNKDFCSPVLPREKFR